MIGSNLMHLLEIGVGWNRNLYINREINFFFFDSDSVSFQRYYYFIIFLIN